MFTMIDQLFGRAVGSDVFFAGIALALMGAVFAYLRMAIAGLRYLFERRLVASVTVDSRSEAYRYLCLWMEQSGALSHVRHLKLAQPARGGEELYAPAPGRYFFVYRGRLCRFSREMRKAPSGGRQPTLEEMAISVLFGRPALLRDWIREGAGIAADHDRGQPRLHALSDGWWEHICDLTPRGLDTVLSDDDRIDRLAEDMRWFFASADWYRARGVPLRRGYLLYGPPGTGKSSVIRALASDLGRDVDDIGRGPLRTTAANLMQKARIYCHALARMRDLGVKL